MSIYKPTRLYVKRHSVTGLRYFGKSIRKDIEKYKGSGTRWYNHIKKHGKEHVVTEWVSDWFYDKEELVSFALSFSEIFDVVDSDEWANLIAENGLDGAPIGHEGHKFTAEQLNKISTASKKRWQDSDYRIRVTESQSASWTDQRKNTQAKKLSGKKRPEHSEAMKGHKLKNNHPFFNEHKTIEHRQNISKSLTGKSKSDDHKINLKKAIHNRSPDEWQKILDKRRSKPKVEIGGVVYSSVKHAAEVLGISPYLAKKRVTRRF